MLLSRFQVNEELKNRTFKAKLDLVFCDLAQVHKSTLIWLEANIVRAGVHVGLRYVWTALPPGLGENSLEEAV